eukprot:8919621-Ditylum_brightwellii.AAC.1
MLRPLTSLALRLHLLVPPFSILNKTDLPEPLFFCDTVSGHNVLLVSLIDVAFFCVVITKTM